MFLESENKVLLHISFSLVFKKKQHVKETLQNTSKTEIRTKPKVKPENYDPFKSQFYLRYF